MTHRIRMASAKDKDALLRLMHDHALYEGHNLRGPTNSERLANPASLPVSLFVVESGGRLLGYMSAIRQYSTWDLEWYLYLDCLYLAEEARGLGLGRELMAALKRHGRDIGVATIQWQTPSSNHSAIAFYTRLGAVAKPKQRFFWTV